MSTPPKPSLCMIPGPVEMDETVLYAMSRKATSHLDPEFIQVFSEIFGQLRKLFHAHETTQPFVVAGSGTLAWDMVATNLVQPNEDVLVVSTGIFGDWFGECLEMYQAKVTYLKAPNLGDLPNETEFIQVLQSKPFKLVTLTHVDTSTGVLIPLNNYVKLIRQFLPTTLIVLDAVCSAGAEHIDMQSQSLDVVLSASQKALGAPAGLSILLVSQQALNQCQPRSYYLSWHKWIPIMNAYEQKKPSYFATPPVSLIFALHSALHCIPFSTFVDLHVLSSQKIRETIQLYDFQFVTHHPAHTLTAVYLPPNVSLPTLLTAMHAHGITIAGGVYPGLQHTYFRIGHMGVSATHPKKGHVDRLIQALHYVFHSLGFERKK